jgi:poly-gamma-glutamate synthesis protein (capsule biosynthesis protein)
MKKPTIKFSIFLFIPLCVLQAGLIYFSIKKSTATPTKEIKYFAEPASGEFSSQLGDELLQEEIKEEKKQVEPKEVKPLAISFLFFGDMMLDRSVGKRIKEKGLDYLFEKLADEENKFFQGIDIIGCNLEGAVTNNGSHYAPQVAYDFAFHPDLINQLKKYNFNFFNLANNHLYDQGKRGVNETEKNLSEMNFNYSGCVDGVIDECSSKIIDISNKKIAMAGFSTVYSKLDKEKLKTEIKNLADKSDLVIVNMHWGIEYTNIFNKTQQELAHILIDAGANIVIGHHPHVVQGIEIYKNRPIFYSLGNFIFDQYFSKETQEGFAVGINIEDEKTSIFLYPFKSKLSQVELMEEKEKQEFLKNLVDWSEVEDDHIEQIKNGRIEL